MLKPTFKLAAAVAAGAFALSASIGAFAADITGAGATFPYPIYAKWADAYKKASGNGLNYQSIGSGGGIKQIEAKTVDFGASDMPLSGDDLDKNNLVQFPAVMGGIVPVINLKDVKTGELKFTGELLAAIYNGKVTKWNDPAIVALNPTAKLTDEAISVVHRSDGSGTTFVWTNFLSKTSADWKASVGEGTSVKWAVGVGGKGNEGVASYVQRINGAIGYVEYAYAKQNKLAYGLVKNKDGAYPLPEDDSFKAAAAGADWSKAPGMGVLLTDQPGKATWPITSATFILMQKSQDNPANGREVLKFFDWSFKNGAAMAAELDYVPLPASVVKMIQAEWKSIKDTSGKSIY
jgi:phosphate transport system substrate-binding protein